MIKKFQWIVRLSKKEVRRAFVNLMYMFNEVSKNASMDENKTCGIDLMRVTCLPYPLKTPILHS